MKHPFIVAFAAIGTIAAAVVVKAVIPVTYGPGADSASPPASSMSAGMRFTDDKGRERQPSALEHAELAAAFRDDLADLTRNKRIPSGSKRENSGAISAVVATRRLQAIVVSVEEDGELSFSHGALREDGDAESSPASRLPEM